MTFRAPAILRTTTFRLAILAATLFAISSGLIIIYIYGSVASGLARQVDRSLSAESEPFEAAYRTGGLSGLNRAVIQRSLTDEDYLYLLVYPNGRRLSGNLDSLPDASEVGERTVRFEYRKPRGSEDEIELRRARGRLTDFPGGYVLLVGMDVEENGRIVGRIAGQAWVAGGLVLVLGVISGSFVSNRFVRRLERLNRVAGRVRAGELHHRAPRNHSGDELDELSANLNNMLERIERLMAAMRSAGDAIAHDLRSPLTRMRTSIEAAIADASDNDEASTLSRALEEADALLATFNGVMRISRLEAGERRDALVDLDATELLKDVAELYEPVCEDRGIDFVVELESNLFLRGDRPLLSQAIANLLDNAVKYTPSGAAVALRLRRHSSGGVEISVTDTGVGIPAADRDRVKQRFVRLEASRSEPGSGLGLSLVQAVADMHHAEFLLEDGPGEVGGSGPGLRAAMVFAAPEHTDAG